MNKKSEPLNIIGISAFYHDSACCLLQDGVLIAAAQEERFSRRKFDASLPVKAFQYCLEQGGLTIRDIHCLAYYENPEKKLARQLWSGYSWDSPKMTDKLDPHRPEREIRELLGYEGPIKFMEHHLSHAASSYYFSGFNQSAILTVDGVGEWATCTYGQAKGHQIELFEDVHFPDSLGLLYGTITAYLGFRINSDEYKVMGLAPYGKPFYVPKIRQLVQCLDKGQFQLDMKYFDYITGNKMYSEELIELLGRPPREPESDIHQFHKDVARSLQQVLEEILLEKVAYLYHRTGVKNLCMAGGVALNCVANGRMLRDSPFERLFVQPAANDAGGAAGAAALAHAELTNKHPNHIQLRHVYLGPQYSSEDIRRLLNATSLKFKDFHGKQEQLLKETARLLAKGKVIGWFQGRMEYGPRALGNRSILADPRDPGMRDRVNAVVKKREAFRPFAPVVLEEKMKEHFDIDHPSPFMLETCQVISPLDLPAITHIDGSARIQSISWEINPLYADLILEFEKLTGCPVLLNTSFNVRGEPIVCNPTEALECFISTRIDCLILGDFLVDRSENNLELLSVLVNIQKGITGQQLSDVYTFI
ncbi:MAG: carbamoyltransferase N-terminal domain-containing protein [Candidatus Aminicenantes bacterium]|jgi:carbamoyltransferase